MLWTLRAFTLLRKFCLFTISILHIMQDVHATSDIRGVGYMCSFQAHMCGYVCVYAQCVDMQCICTFFRTNTNVHVFHEIWFSIVCTSCLNVYIYMPFLLFNRMKTFQLHLHLHMLTIYFQVFVQMIDYIFEVEHTEVNTKRSTYSHIQSHTATFTYIQTDRQAGWQTDIQTYIHTDMHTYRQPDMQT